MAENPDWAPRGFDAIVPNVARVYDYLLDGSHNFAVDREMANKVEQAMPGIRDGVRINRSFLRRAVRFMVDSGIRQFLDIGSGIPTVGNVHEIAQRADPECRIVYVDKESVAVAHSELLLEGNDRAAAIQANVRDVEDILGHPETKRLLDFDQPIGLRFSFTATRRNRCATAAARRCCACSPGSSRSSRDWLAALSGGPRDQVTPPPTPR